MSVLFMSYTGIKVERRFEAYKNVAPIPCRGFMEFCAIRCAWK